MQDTCPNLYSNISDINCGELVVIIYIYLVGLLKTLLFCGILQVNASWLSHNTSYKAHVKVFDKKTKRTSNSFQTVKIIDGLPPPIK